MAPRTFAIPSLNGLRAVSIGIVFFGHAVTNKLIMPASGVTIFFFLSGFLITTLFRREVDIHGRISLRSFYLRRALRIFPPMYIVMAIAVVLAVTGVLAEPYSWTAIGATALHLTNYWTVVHGNGDLVHTIAIYWSLAVEEHFYLLFPLLLLGMLKLGLSRQRMAVILTVLALAILVWRTSLVFPFHGYATYQRVYFATDTRADGILWGCVMALTANPALGDRIPGSRRLWNVVILPVAVVLFWVAQGVSNPLYWSVGFDLQAAAIAAVFVAVITWTDTPVGRFLNWRPVAQIGIWSYTIYLVHRVMLYLFSQAAGLPKLPTAVLGLLASLVFAWASYRWVEEPSARLRRRLARSAEAEGAEQLEAAPLAEGHLAEPVTEAHLEPR